MSDQAPALLWFTRDLRLADQPALAACVASGRPVVAFYVFDPEQGGAWAMGAASRWWLHTSLAALAADLAAAGCALVLRRGESVAAVAALVRETGAACLHVGQPPEPAARAALDQVEAAVAGLGCATVRHRTMLLFDPGSVRTQSGGHFTVFSPFARACQVLGVSEPAMAAPARIVGRAGVRSDDLDGWELRPTHPDWAGGMRAAWTPGERGAQARLAAFVAAGLAGYDTGRNVPGGDGTSSLSAHLHWGEIAAGAVWAGSAVAAGKAGQSYRSELLWREFCGHLLWHFPSLPDVPLRESFAAMRWREDPAALRAWQRGRTGIPIVDAGMRQLWQTGWQHNRVRMITASFLIKHLLIDWRVGEAWFWDCLVDADLASNAASWQWVAGCGADAAPFFRIFNPWLQGQKFDPEGVYVRRWVPELAGLPDKYVHAPQEAPAEVLADAGVVLGGNYPKAIVDLREGRARALAAFAEVKARPGALPSHGEQVDWIERRRSKLGR